ncbi:MAG: hypothetical protein H0X30_34625, partial [Anaerolineae bacterium]|nr:hypothetical protein [Anaerolineae bacterium]
ASRVASQLNALAPQAPEGWMQRPASAAWVRWHLSAITPVVAIYRVHRIHRMPSGALKTLKYVGV